MAVKLNALPPGEFIRDHLVDVGGVDFTQNIHKAYKTYLIQHGYPKAISRETMSTYMWRARQLGLIVFDHAETRAYWDGQVGGSRIPRAYTPAPRPLGSPSETLPTD